MTQVPPKHPKIEVLNVNGEVTARIPQQQAGKDLEGCNLSGEDLYQAQLQGRNLKGTVLYWGSLWNANLDGACYDDETVFPAEFHRGRRGVIYSLD